MWEFEQADPFVLSSLCPYSRSIVTSARRIGGILDPSFLGRCQITDESLKKTIDQLKQVPFSYEPRSSAFDQPSEVFLDIDLPSKKRFFHSAEFERYNTWLNDPNQWNIISTLHDDLLV